jgi:hypothetical protein
VLGTQDPVLGNGRRRLPAKPVFEPVLNRLTHRVVIANHRETVSLVLQEFAELRNGVSLGSAERTPDLTFAPAVVTNRRCRDPTLPGLIPVQAPIPPGAPSRQGSLSREATYSASAATGTSRRRPCFTLRR